ncbi:MAG TPA: AraC family transcriptional regulator [Chiayiivirga sp.]|nr:AraC family transcriptional regulator [Chiayiivirga sp.]
MLQDAHPIPCQSVPTATDTSPHAQSRRHAALALRGGLVVAHHRGELRLNQASHGLIHFIVCLRGHATVTLGAHSIRVGSRTMLALYPEHGAFGATASCCAQFICLSLSAVALRELSGDCVEALVRDLARPRTRTLDPETLHAATQLQSGLLHDRTCRLLREAWSLEVLARALACTRQADCAVMDASEHAALHHARDLVLGDLSAAPNLDALASACHLSVSRLKRGFRTLFGQSIHAHYQHERMRVAWRLIESGQMDVSAAGLQVGYSNLSHFSDNFRRHHGILPSELKRCALASQLSTPLRPL